MNNELTNEDLEQMVFDEDLQVSEELDTGTNLTAAVASQEESWVTEAMYQGHDNDEGAW
tara:strand:- start:628 stop:804 length:177 start_codon:yes stop_codon:yes gene_type:complete